MLLHFMRSGNSPSFVPIEVLVTAILFAIVLPDASSSLAFGSGVRDLAYQGCQENHVKQ